VTIRKRSPSWLFGYGVRRDEATFDALVRRYGGLVLIVCRHVRHNEPVIKEADHASFSLLARADWPRQPRALARWPHSVTDGALLRARRDTAGRRARVTLSRPFPLKTGVIAAGSWRKLLATWTGRGGGRARN
jgi:hypothetical protein